MKTPSKRLFQAIVVLGAATATRCGGAVVVEGTGHGSGTGGGGGAESSSSGDLFSASSGGTCLSKMIGDCKSPAQFHCDSCVGGAGHKSCYCDSDSPLGPGDCATTADFHCQSYQPYTTCECLAGSPMTPKSCSDPKDFHCAGGYEPPIGCFCIHTITK